MPCCLYADGCRSLEFPGDRRPAEPPDQIGSDEGLICLRCTAISSTIDKKASTAAALMAQAPCPLCHVCFALERSTGCDPRPFDAKMVQNCNRILTEAFDRIARV